MRIVMQNTTQRVQINKSVEITNKMQACNRIYYSKVFFLKAQHVSSGTPLIIRSSKLYLRPLVYIHMWWPAVVKADDGRCAARKMLSLQKNFGIINLLQAASCWYRVFTLKVDRTLMWLIYLLRFTTCYITQLTCIYSKCWKRCPFISVHLSTLSTRFTMFLATFLSEPVSRNF